MPRLSFSLRDVFWLTLIVGMGCAWWVARKDAGKARHEMEAAQREFRGMKVDYEKASQTAAMWELRYVTYISEAARKAASGSADEPVGQP